jgi:hypothetical protein
MLNNARSSWAARSGQGTRAWVGTARRRRPATPASSLGVDPVSSEANQRVKGTLRRRLQTDARALGLTSGAVDALVAAALINRADRGSVLFEDTDASDVLSYLVAGVARVDCRGPTARL